MNVSLTLVYDLFSKVTCFGSREFTVREFPNQWGNDMSKKVARPKERVLIWLYGCTVTDKKRLCLTVYF